VSCLLVPTEWPLNGVGLQILPRSTVVAPSSDGPAFSRMVLRRLVEEVFLLRTPDLRGELFLSVCKYAFTQLDHKDLLHDPLSYVRTQTTSLVLTLLRDKPEQEQNLLRLLVNKLVCVKLGRLIVYSNLFHRVTWKSRFHLVSHTTFSNSSKRTHL